MNGLVNFPQYSALKNDTGIVVGLKRPSFAAPKLYWNDTLVTGGQLQLDGCQAAAPFGCHEWHGCSTDCTPMWSGWGWAKTINTWWFSGIPDTLHNMSLLTQAAKPDSIHGLKESCFTPGGQYSYSIFPNPLQGATAYTWKLNNGASTIQTWITPTAVNNAISFPGPGNFSLIAGGNNLCGNGNFDTLHVLITPSFQVSISISGSATVVCEGTAVTFTASAVNGVNSPVYQWKVNFVNTGTNTSAYTYNPVNGDIVSCQLTSNLDCTYGNPASSNPLTVSVSAGPSVSFTSCYDTVTAISAKPFKLKGGVPLGGTYSGPGVNSSTGYFNPAAAGPGLKTILYTYQNQAQCSNAKTRTILVLAAPPFACGQSWTDIRDGKTYPTVQLGSQCWMQKNLDYGTMTSAVSHQQDNCISEKYCYNNDVTNCTKYGGLYQWDELMQFQDTPGLQGLCPPGWHVPAQTEWNTLFNYYQGQGIAGKTMQDSIISGFRVKESGVIYSNASWKFQGFGAIFWTSTPSGTIKAISHGLNQINFSVSDYPANRSNAFATRCLRD